jgi:PIN domain nuclease of toxin-antitoxin system
VKPLLDTCTLLWEWFDPDKVSLTAREAIVRSETVYVSTVSLAEIAIKDSRKPFLTAPFDEFLDRISAHPNYAIVEFTEHATRELRRLPAHHKDPFDRMLVSLAVAEGFTLLTNDRFIRLYSIPLLW